METKQQRGHLNENEKAKNAPLQQVGVRRGALNGELIRVRVRIHAIRLQSV